MRRPMLLLAAFVVVIAGCGDGDDSTPVACLQGPQPYLRALERAPGEVRLEGETPISQCLAENQAGGALAEVGTAMLGAVTRLNSEARAQPGGAANVRLGYLLGATKRGASRSEGIHAELLRRLSVAAGYSPGDRRLPSAFFRAYRRGFDAGQASG